MVSGRMVLFLMAEQAKESGEKLEELSWEELAGDA